MADNFDLRKFLSENKLTKASKTLNENDDEMFLDEVFDILNDQMRLDEISGKAKPYKPKYNPMASLGGGKGYHIDEDKFDDKITNLKKYTYTLNGKKVTPEIGYFDHSLRAMISTPRSGDEYFDYEFYRIGEPDESGNIELSPEKGKRGMYTEEMADNFDLRKFLSENKLTKASKVLNENENEYDNEMFLDAVFDILNDQMRLGEITAKDFKAAKKYLEKHEIELFQQYIEDNPEVANAKDADDAFDAATEKAAQGIRDIVLAQSKSPEF
jgi:hypothetical protein